MIAGRMLVAHPGAKQRHAQTQQRPGQLAAQPVQRALADLVDPDIEVLETNPLGTPFPAGEGRL